MGSSVSWTNNNLDVHRIPEQLAIGTDRLPLASICPCNGGGDEDDPQGDLRASPRRVERNLGGRAERLVVDVTQQVYSKRLRF